MYRVCRELLHWPLVSRTQPTRLSRKFVKVNTYITPAFNKLSIITLLKSCVSFSNFSGTKYLADRISIISRKFVVWFLSHTCNISILGVFGLKLCFEVITCSANEDLKMKVCRCIAYFSCYLLGVLIRSSFYGSETSPYIKTTTNTR